jgi:hypothetical protein
MCSEPHIPRQRDSCLTSNVGEKMITEADISLTIGCPVAPESFEAVFRLRYSAAYLEDERPKRAAFEKDYHVHKDQCYFVRFSEGSVVQFGHIPLFAAWTNAVKRHLAHYEVESYWGYHVCEVMPTMGEVDPVRWTADRGD